MTITLLKNRPALKAMTILVVEDSELLQEMLRYSFDSAHTVVLASNVTEAWQLYLSHEPDIVFLDIGLPDGSGHDLAFMIKSRTPKTGVIMATASRSIDDKKEAATNNVDGFITKPFSKQAVNNLVDWYIDKLRNDDRNF